MFVQIFQFNSLFALNGLESFNLTRKALRARFEVLDDQSGADNSRPSSARRFGYKLADHLGDRHHSLLTAHPNNNNSKPSSNSSAQNQT